MAILLSFFIFIFSCFSSAVSAQTLSDQIQQTAQSIRNDFLIEIVYLPREVSFPPQIKFDYSEKSEEMSLLNYITLIKEELSKYPSSCFDNIGLKQLWVVKRLFLNKRPVEGIYNSKMRVIFLDFKRSQRRSLVQRHNFHHELFHQMEIGALKNPQDWEKFNQDDFEYSRKFMDRQLKENPVNYFAPGQLGFVTHYSMTSSQEDRAEIFASLMIESQNRLLHKWTEKDARLKDKVNFVKGFVYNVCPAMNEDFWRSLFN